MIPGSTTTSRPPAVRSMAGSSRRSSCRRSTFVFWMRAVGERHAAGNQSDLASSSWSKPMVDISRAPADGVEEARYHATTNRLVAGRLVVLRAVTFVEPQPLGIARNMREAPPYVECGFGSLERVIESISTDVYAWVGFCPGPPVGPSAPCRTVLPPNERSGSDSDHPFARTRARSSSRCRVNAAQHRKIEASSRTTAHILVVDDDPGVPKCVARQLAPPDHTTVFARSARAAAVSLATKNLSSGSSQPALVHTPPPDPRAHPVGQRLQQRVVDVRGHMPQRPAARASTIRLRRVRMR